MDTMKSIILLEMLYRQSPDNRDAILNMFMELVDKTDVYQRLENTLVSNIFSGPDAESWHKKASALLTEVRVRPQEAIHLFFSLEEYVLHLEEKKKESEAALEHVDFFENRPSVVSKIQAATTTKFYEMFYRALTYLSITLYGMEGLSDWSTFPVGSFTDLMRFVDDVLVKKIKEKKPLKRKWFVEEKFFSGGKVGISYNGCALNYEDNTSLTQIGTHHHPYIRTGGFGEKKLVEGYGYITGVSVNEVEALLEGELINNINVSNVQIDPMFVDSAVLYNPPEFLAKILGTRKFVLAPEIYVKLLNKYFLNKTAQERASAARCILCDRQLETNGTVCAYHFDYTNNL